MPRRRGPATRLQVFTIEYLVNLALEGHIRLPQFGRRLVWRQDNVRLLFDSIARGYPIGTFMFSETAAGPEEVDFGPIRIASPADERALLLVDGQQRLVSIIAALTRSDVKDRRFSLAYDLRADEIISDNGIADRYVIPLPVLFDRAALVQRLSSDAGDLDLLEQATDISSRIRNYEVAAHVIRSGESEEAYLIFERLNTSGVTLNPADLFAAAAGAGETGSPRHINNIVQRLADRTGFGILNEDLILRSILAARDIDASRILATSPAELQLAYDEGERYILSVVEFLQDQCGVPHLAFLPDRNIITPLVRIFAHRLNPGPRNLRLLRRWVWRELAMRTYGHNEDSSAHITERIDENYSPDIYDAVRAGLRESKARHRVSLRDTPFSPRSPATRIVLCSWWSEKPRDLRSGIVIGRDELAEALGGAATASKIVPTVTRGAGVPASASENRIIDLYERNPEKSLRELCAGEAIYHSADGRREAVLRSHLISPAAAQAFASGDVTRFAALRLATIRQSLVEFTDRMCEWDFEDTPPLRDLVIADESDLE